MVDRNFIENLAEYRSDLNASHVDKEVLARALRNLSIEEDQTAKLPKGWRELYEIRNLRKTLLAKNHSVFAIECKIRLGMDLNDREKDMYNQYKHKISAIDSSQVEVEAVDLLNDVVKGDYTLSDIHLVRQGIDEAAEMDPVENSPLLLLDSLIESAMEQTHDVLQTKEPGHFFGSFSEEMHGNLEPGQISDVIRNAATAVGIMQGKKVEQNEAQTCIDSYIISQVMHEAESKLKQIEGNITDKTNQDEPSADQRNESKEKEPSASKRLSFNITELNYEVSMAPADDPDVYKPLEIISWIGMTKNAS